MPWQAYELTYELLSPLHIGYHNIGNVQRTRYYVPARNMWASVTERLTRSGFSVTGREGDYQQVGEWLKECCAFGYLFLCDGGNLLCPHFTENGLRYGSYSAAEFERNWVSAHVTTALDPATTSAQEASLHEVEFLAPHGAAAERHVQRTQFRGSIFLQPDAVDRMGEPGSSEWLAELQVGGERRYGFGRLRLCGCRPQNTEALGGWCTVELGAGRPRITVPAQNPLLAHTPAKGVTARGMVEPLVGRETARDSGTFGRRLTTAHVCWVPGSALEEQATFQIHPEGYWTLESRG